MEQSIASLRAALQANPDFSSRTEEDIVGDYRLQRFLMSRGNDLEKAKALFEDHLKWRKEHNLEAIRAKVIDKPLLVASLPHTAELKAAGMGMLHSVINGGRSRTGEIIHIEVIGGTAHILIPEGHSEEYVEKLYEHYYGFFERRCIEMERLSKSEQRFVRSIQIRDFSQMSMMPQGGVMNVVRKILKSGLGKECINETSAVTIAYSPILTTLAGA